MAVKVLLDTDIDDALCLAYLLGQPECDLVGITTVTGEAEKRAMLASAVCRAAGRDDVPIFPGAAKPILGRQLQETAPQAEVLGRRAHRSDFPFRPDLCRFAEGEVEVALAPPGTAGATRWREGGRRSHRVALHVDPDRFFEHYFQTEGGAR